MQSKLSVTAASAATASSAAQRLRDLYLLTKPNLTLLVVITTLLGLSLAADAYLPASLMLATLIGTALTGGGACALNMAMESAYDRRMARTRHRPVAADRVSHEEAVAFGIALVSLGGVILWSYTNPLTALLSLLAAAVYVFAYTPLKRVTPWATVVGAIPGALPPMMGYTAANASIGRDAWIVFFILFFWQLPHFWALAILYKTDYDRGGFKLWPGPAGSQKGVELRVLLTTIALFLTSLGLFAVGAAGVIYVVGAFVLGTFFLMQAVRLAFEHDRAAARRVFLTSIVYLPMLIGFLIADRPRLLLNALHL
ncbi:MAG: protoheme IX farnesyltransferase [Deltaproteobacteria bacterium]|nr:protoheme IX farnesyltransferase [Deltaproteobacteria bacterium]